MTETMCLFADEDVRAYDTSALLKAVGEVCASRKSLPPLACEMTQRSRVVNSHFSQLSTGRMQPKVSLSETFK